MTNFSHCSAARLSPITQLSEKGRVVYRSAAEPAFAELMRSAERLNVVDQVVHLHHMRRICPSRQEVGDGYVRKLWRTGPSWDRATMADPEFDIVRIRDVLREATQPGATFSQRSLAKEAGEGRDAVGDILNGRNKNPTTKVLSNLARALGGDLSMFGLAEDRSETPVGVVTEAELERALLEAMPNMPPRGSMDKRARFLAANVAQILKLPSGQQPIPPHAGLSGDGEDVPPHAPTN